MSRIREKLPDSPLKRQQTIQGIGAAFGFKLLNSMNNNLHPNKGLSAEEKDTVVDFFFRTDIVYTSPGMKEEMTVWTDDGEKQRLRKYYLTMYLKEAHLLFTSTHPDIQVNYDKFIKLRPKNVLCLKDSPCDQCKCRIHENFCLKLKGLKVEYGEEFWNKYLCDNDNQTHNSDCWLSMCGVCLGGKKLRQQCDDDGSLGSETNWKEWKADENGRLFLSTNSGCVGELLELIQLSWMSFVEHVRIKHIQAAAFEREKKDPNCSVLQMDFAMNYSCEYQNEIMSALWSRASVGLFTAALYERDLPCQSFIIATDSNDKYKDTVFCFLTKLFEQFKNKELGNYISMFTDGPSSEFKNKYCVEMLKLLGQKFFINTRWQYFATSHGKGVVDGIGGSAKSSVRRAVMSKGGNCVVQSSKDFAEVARYSLPNVTVLHVDSGEIEQFKEMFCKWENVPQRVGISKVHAVTYTEGKISLFETDNELQSSLQKTKNTDTDNNNINIEQRENLPTAVEDDDVFKKNDWVLVFYEGKEYPGEIVSITDAGVAGDFQVSVMHSRLGKWKWPEHEDCIMYEKKNIIRKIQPPVPANTRGYFVFSDI